MCVNLDGLERTQVKKLTSWKCPRCYSSPYAVHTNAAIEVIDQKFQARITEINQYNDDLKENASSIDTFNQRIRHLLLDDKWTTQASKIGDIESDISDIKDTLKKLQSEYKAAPVPPIPSSFSDDICANITTFLSEKIAAEVKAMMDTHTTVEPDLVTNINLQLDQSKKNNEDIMKAILDLQTEVEGLVDKVNNPIEIQTGVGVNEEHERLMKVVSDQLKVLSSQSHSATLNTVSFPGGNITTSPHVENLTSFSMASGSNDIPESKDLPPLPPCEPYVSYSIDAVDAGMKAKLNEFVEENNDKFEDIAGSRSMYYCGEYGYWYTGKYHQPCETPEVIQDLLDSVRPHLSNPCALLNSCLVTVYKDGTDNIPLHSDDEALIDPESEIICVSIGSDRKLEFVNNYNDEKKSLDLTDGSVYVMNRHSQDQWKHAIYPTTEETGKRVSFTFRHIDPKFANSTMIIGDSNTKYLTFGKGQGTFGRSMPGKRVKASVIEDIPEPEQIGPMRNVVIHTGINNINDFGVRRRPNHILVNMLEQKCRRIKEAYPKTRLFISLLLPTKIPHLNLKVKEFNDLLLEMTYRNKSFKIIDSNSMFLDRYGCLDAELGRFNRGSGRPNSSDFIHLGRKGLNVFSTHIKRCIFTKANNQSSERFRASGGAYNAAANRVQRDGYQGRSPW